MSGDQRKPENKEPNADADLLRAYLSERDAACPTCGYNLRGLGQCTCPECGDGLSLTVTNYPSRMAGYTFGLVCLTSSVILGLFLAVIEFREFPLVSVVSMIAVVWLSYGIRRWRRNRRAFTALPRHKKQERVVVCFIGTVLFVLVVTGAAWPA